MTIKTQGARFQNSLGAIVTGEQRQQIRYVLPHGGRRDMQLGRDNNSVLVVDSGPSVLLSIDLTTGDISTVSGFDNESSARIGSGPGVGEPVAMIVDAANNRLQVLDSAVRGVFAVDLATGNQVITSWPWLPNG